MSIPEVCSMPGKSKIERNTEVYPGTRAYVTVVTTLLDRCSSPRDIFIATRELERSGGWREAFELLNQARWKFPDSAEAFGKQQAEMSMSRKIQKYTFDEIAGKRRPEPEQLLRIELEA